MVTLVRAIAGGRLTKTARILLPQITRLAATDLSANAALRTLRSALTPGILGVPGGIARQAFLDAFRSARGQTLSATNIRNTRRSSIINVDRIVQSKTRILSEYSYTVRVDGFGPDGRSTRFITIRTNNAELSRGEIEDEAMAIILDDQGKYGFEPATATIQSARRRR